MSILFHGLPSAEVARIRTGRRDAYGLAVEEHISDGNAYPCRHCLDETPTGAAYLILAHRPFETVNAYTETGPIFLCAEGCRPAQPSAEVPAILRAPTFLVRGYTGEERIRYGTGQVVRTDEIASKAEDILRDPDIAFVDVRSAANNCFQ